MDDGRRGEPEFGGCTGFIVIDWLEGVELFLAGTCVSV
ncbi:hypothetical protein C942_01859 [Photobacterium marinum]|uniref:Uncharacterized protein n=1 Tax=Photobacterium marinum TaxID=1056511 RepID=L8JD23_9GAMM|nr:hypothetical protein C942_01859 [Photobacterium marinum]